MTTTLSRLDLLEGLRQAAPYSLIAFCPFASRGYPGYARHLQAFCAILERFEADVRDLKSPRLLVSMPPRHYKSQTASVSFPAWLLGRNPNWRIILSSYGVSLPYAFSRQIRRAIKSDDYARVFEKTPPITISQESGAVEHWDLAAPYLGGLRSTSINGGVTGHGANVIIVDDPIKNRAEARSEAYKRKIRETYSAELRTRLEPGGGIIVIATRWATDDLIGWLQRQSDDDEGEKFEVINFSAEAEPGDSLGREPGEALFPEKFDKSELEKIKKALLKNDYEALYKGRPQAEGGGKFKLEWFNRRPQAPHIKNLVRAWDTALTKDSRQRAQSTGGPDPTCGVLGGFSGHDYWVIHRVHECLEEPEVIDLVVRTAITDLKNYGCKHVAIETGARGGVYQHVVRRPEIMQNKIRVIPITPILDKEERAYGLMTHAQGGLVYVLEAGWTDHFVNEHVQFGAGGHDDQVDANAHCFNTAQSEFGKRGTSDIYMGVM